jgi:hypothetical protein
MNVIDIQFGLVSIHNYPYLDEDGNWQWETHINQNGETTIHRPVRMIYDD